MGMFKDLRELTKSGRKMQKQQGGTFSMMKDGLAQANELMQQVEDDQDLAETLANEGVEGTATIQEMTGTGRMINMQPELQFVLAVNVGGDTRTVNHRQAVSPAVIGRLQPGAEVPVKVDPNDHSRLLIGLDG